MQHGRTIAIGDIHGCVSALRTLIELIEPRPDDTLVTLGDYVDRGPDSRAVIDELLGLQHRCRLIPLLGNHEILLLEALRSPGQQAMWLACGGQQTLDSYGGTLDRFPDEHRVFLASCRPYHETSTHVFVHANYEPHAPFADHCEQTRYWTHMLSRTPARHVSGKTVIVGHTPQPSGEIRDEGHVIVIDTFCFGGGWLTALDVDRRTIWKADRDGRAGG